MYQLVGVNDRGIRVGQYHQNASVTDREIQLLLALRAEGWGYRRLAAKFEISKRAVREYVAGRRRNQVPTAWKLVQVLQPRSQ